MVYRFCLQQSASPTHFNLVHALRESGWYATRFNWRADFAEENLAFDLRAAQHLEYKHLLAELLAQFCSQVMPVTYCINDKNYSYVLDKLAEHYYFHNNTALDSVENLIWILKPSLQNNGQNIKIFQRLSEIYQHFLNPRRLGGEHVLQQYIPNPHLLQDHKYSIRMFVIITNDAGSYLYPHGYFNVAKEIYQPQTFVDLNPHITNEYLREDAANVLQIPTQRGDFFPPLFSQIKAIVAETVQGLMQSQPQAFLPSKQRKQRKLAFFGYDFLVDSNSRVWLLEVNHGPCFPTNPNHVLQKYLYHDFWKAVVDIFVLPIANKTAIGKSLPFEFVEATTED